MSIIRMDGLARSSEAVAEGGPASEVVISIFGLNDGAGELWRCRTGRCKSLRHGHKAGRDAWTADMQVAFRRVASEIKMQVVFVAPV